MLPSPFFKGSMPVKGGSLINKWNQFNKWLCPIFGSLLSERATQSHSLAVMVSTFQAAAWRVGNLNFIYFYPFEFWERN